MVYKMAIPPRIVFIVLVDLALHVYVETGAVVPSSELSGQVSFGTAPSYETKNDASSSQNSVGSLITTISNSHKNLLGSKSTNDVSFVSTNINGDQISFGYSVDNVDQSLLLGLVPGQKVKMVGFITASHNPANLGKQYDVSANVTHDGKFFKIKMMEK